MRLIFLGPPGAGKGTVAGLLSERLGLAHVASGDLLRAAVQKGEPLGKQAQGYLQQGVLVPDHLVTGMVLDFVKGLGAKRDFVLDGFPRTAGQAQALDETLAKEGQPPVDLAIDFSVSRAKIVERLSGRRVCSRCQTPYHTQTLVPKVAGVCDRCGGELVSRPDDEPQTVLRRLEVYEETSRPLIDFYRRQGRLRRVDGEGDKEGTFTSVMQLLRAEGLVQGGVG